jgi:hypothetical protein
MNRERASQFLHMVSGSNSSPPRNGVIGMPLTVSFPQPPNEDVESFHK